MLEPGAGRDHMEGARLIRSSHLPVALLPFLLLTIPVLEIGVFIAIGQWIGIWWTLAGILITAIVGTMLLRREGFRVLTRIREETVRGGLPGRALGEGAMILVAGILLLTPGFVTDAVGFSLFVPGVRGVIWRALAGRLAGAFSVHTASSMRAGMGMGPDPERGPRRDGVVDLDESEFTDLTPDPDSPWTDKDVGVASESDSDPRRG